MEIRGNIKNIPASKIYLTDAYEWDKFIDSSTYTNGNFQFFLDTSRFYEPFLASICILVDGKRIQQLGVIDYKRTTLTDTFSNTGFMLSWGVTELYGDYNNPFQRVSIKPNSENDLLFDQSTRSVATLASINKLQKMIQKNPTSYYLLGKMYENRQMYTTLDITASLSLFDERLQNSQTALLLKVYAANLIKKGSPFMNSQVEDSDGRVKGVFGDSNNSKLTMLIFWASWCAPCRLEIPDLKNIYKSLDTGRFEMKSISIDEDRTNWHQALVKEKMDWGQYLIPAKDMFKFKAQFAISAIPVVVFVDSNHIELKRFVGYTKENSNRYIEFIESYLTK
jgi:thiol-disulfide isomerase/thioredoxin